MCDIDSDVGSSATGKQLG